MNTSGRRVLVTGGAGYLGCVLVPKLVDRGHEVCILDAMHFGREHAERLAALSGVTAVQGDVRDLEKVSGLFADGGFTDVIHLAAIANDPCADLDEALTQGVNYDAVVHLMETAKASGVGRFLYASSASVYGIKEEEDVTEDLPLEPITIYARLKVEGEKVLNRLVDDSFVGCHVRAATVCGFSPRLRLDLTVNLLTHQALTLGEIRVFGGSQKRPNIHIQDLTDFYTLLLDADAGKINGEAFNVSYENATVMSLAERIRDEVDADLPIRVVPTEDIRSYHLSPEKAARVLDFHPKKTVTDAIVEVKAAFDAGKLDDHGASHYRNVVFMRENPELWSKVSTWAPLG